MYTVELVSRFPLNAVVSSCVINETRVVPVCSHELLCNTGVYTHEEEDVAKEGDLLRLFTE